MDFPKSSGIYIIMNTANEKCYVGQSDNVDRRIKAHKCALRNGTHYNNYLQRSWDKYGEDSFEFALLEACSKSDLDAREMYYIKLYDAFNNGYNMNIGGSSNRGYRHTDASRQKMRESHRDVSGERNPMFGHSVQEFMTDAEILSWKRRISQSVAGENNPFFGRTHTAESKEKMSIAHKKKWSGVEHPLYGRKLTEQQRYRLMEAARLYREKNPGFMYITAKKIVCVRTGEVFSSISDAARRYNIGRSNISSCCYGRISYSGTDENGERLVWMFCDDYLRASPEEIAGRLQCADNMRKGKYSGLSKPVVCLTTGEIFESACLAAKHYGIDNSSICKVCHGKLRYCGVSSSGEQLKWSFYKDAEDSTSNCA